MAAKEEQERSGTLKKKKEKKKVKGESPSLKSATTSTSSLLLTFRTTKGAWKLAVKEENENPFEKLVPFPLKTFFLPFFFFSFSLL